MDSNFELSNFDKIPYFTIVLLEKANAWSFQISKTKVINFGGKCKLRQYIIKIYPNLAEIYQINLGYYLNALTKLKDLDILPTKNNLLLFIPKKTLQKLVNTIKVLEVFKYGNLTLYRFNQVNRDWLFKKRKIVILNNPDNDFFKQQMLAELQLQRDQ